MKRTTLVSAVVLLGAIAAIVVAILREVASGPVFRAEDHASCDECMRAIPAEWGPGSLPRSGAGDACMYVHLRGR